MSTELDVVVVGAGFGGLYQLLSLRKRGYSVQVYETAPDLGGTWYWNCYPGARCDSDVPIYEYSLEELWKGWKWTERFPSRSELRAYFDYVDKTFDVRRDIKFNTRVTAAEFNTTTDRWAVTTSDGRVVHPRFFILCTGFASKPYTPPIKGLDTFRGVSHHSALWPQEDIDLTGKRVGVVGTGASGVQIIQESAAITNHLTVFQRTPNIALPMGQHTIDQTSESDAKDNGGYQRVFAFRKTTFAGFALDLIDKNTSDVNTEERRETFDRLWEKGGFWFWLGTFQDMYTNQEANDLAYAYWKDKVRARINDPVKQEILAPTLPPHPFGTKRPALEQAYYEVYNRDNVALINITENPIVEVTPKGILTQDGVEHELDVLVLATGFDAVTGSMSLIDIKGTDGTMLKDKWAKGLTTYLGMTVAKYPNMFFSYGAQAPTAFCNGPTCTELQGDWITNCIDYARANNLTHVEAKEDAQSQWVKIVGDIFQTQLFSKAKSWYTGANIPGKVVESMNFTGGLPLYDKHIREVAEKGYVGFVLKSGNEAEVAFNG
ncbi:cyclohexanone monooxygenase [Hysterangium stoloniferum]|nr:cyclohexanone monooxygenase [Hysterangium stoloniferum]